MTTELLAELLTAVERREPVVLATVVDSRRSVPRRPGSKMLVYGDGRIVGTIGGGEMESRVVAEALDAMSTGRPRRLTYSLLDPSTGDPGVCGGEVELYLEPHMPTSTIFVVGIGHVGRAVVELGSWLGYRVVAWDDRSELAESPIRRADGGELNVLTGSIADALANQPVDVHTRIVMVTRNVALDVDLLPPLLATPAPYIGLMGSERRWATTRQKLVDAGLPEADLARVRAPIGIEIDAETPAEIAVSIMAEVIGHERADRPA
jgi:xanthine dehydrogenase accessory factor